MVEKHYYVYGIALWVLLMVAISSQPSVTGFAAAGDYAPIKNFFSSAPNIELPSSVVKDRQLDVIVRNDLVYKAFAIWTGTQWQMLSFDQIGRGPQSAWINTRASTTVDLASLNLQTGTSYLAFYTCNQVRDEWKCGCLSETECGKWQLARFSVTNEPAPQIPMLPTDPTIDPSSIPCGDNICHLEESCSSCPRDCGQCAGANECNILCGAWSVFSGWDEVCMQDSCKGCDTGQGTCREYLVGQHYDTIRSSDNVVTLIIPRGSYTGSQITIENIGSPAGSPSDTGTHIYKFRPDNIVFNGRPATLRVNYDPSVIETCPTRLNFVLFNEDPNVKTQLPSKSVDCATNTATFEAYEIR